MLKEFVILVVGGVIGYLIHDRYKQKLDLVMGALRADKKSMFYQTGNPGAPVPPQPPIA